MASSGDAGSNRDIPRGLVNRTGTPLGRGSRLPSVRGQRDLTLGGFQRKVFTPNLNAKKKTPSSNEASTGGQGERSTPTAVDKESRGQGRGRGNRGRGRGRGRGEDRTIQLHSEFALGPMGGGSSSGWSRGSSGSGGGGSGAGERGSGESSAVVKASMRQLDTQEDKAFLDTLLRDDFGMDTFSDFFS
ncbi:DNA-directed RNA polymerase III subunit RPC4-like [Elysia marginata]|uniref:DNA-directed RNA polymerase III subunit RPC4-like n=1 Tax=Elysia marginata TaxID=1093978 RepID=A0AAV4JFW8_9GAST|nr:DNA-directed RNA polymerase III subunit RPC4-like [Elysia marginata]